MKSNTELTRFRWQLNGACGLGAIIVCGGLLGGLAYPFHSQASDLKSQANATRAFLESQERIEQEHEKIIQDFHEIEARRESIIARIPDQPDESVFLAQVSRAAENCGLLVQEFRPATAKQMERFGEMEIGIHATGDFKSLCEFLNLIEELPRFTLLSNLEIDADGGGEAMAVKLQLKIFFHQPETTVAVNG